MRSANYVKYSRRQSAEFFVIVVFVEIEEQSVFDCRRVNDSGVKFLQQNPIIANFAFFCFSCFNSGFFAGF